MSYCSDCTKSTTCAYTDIAKQFMFLPGDPVCPICGSRMTGRQDIIPGCTRYNYYTEFVCGSLYYVHYRISNVTFDQESAIVSAVMITDVCRATSTKDDTI